MGSGDGRFGAFLNEEMARRGWTRGSLASHLQVSPHTVRKWIHGDRPSQDMCVHLAEKLDRSVLWVLEAAGYAPGVSGLRDLVEQLNADNSRLMALLRRVPPDDGVHTGLAALLDYLVSHGYSLRVVPWWRGTERRRHYADWLVFDPGPVDARRSGGETPQKHLEKNHAPAMALAMAWWDGPENWEHVLTGSLRPEAKDLVLNVPRFVANRSTTNARPSITYPKSPPRDIVVVGGHWCGQPEVARFLAEWLNYSFALPALAASVVHQVLAQRWDEPNWHADRLAHIRTFALQGPVARQRVWAVDFWDDANTIRAITDTAMLPHVVLLRPDDALYQYAATRRHELGHAGGRTREADLRIMNDARDEVVDIIESLSVENRTIVDVGLVRGAWADGGRTTLPAMDAWMDHYALTAEVIHQILTNAPAPGESVSAIR